MTARRTTPIKKDFCPVGKGIAVQLSNCKSRLALHITRATIAIKGNRDRLRPLRIQSYISIERVIITLLIRSPRSICLGVPASEMKHSISKCVIGQRLIIVSAFCIHISSTTVWIKGHNGWRSPLGIKSCITIDEIVASVGVRHSSTVRLGVPAGKGMS